MRRVCGTIWNFRGAQCYVRNSDTAHADASHTAGNGFDCPEVSLKARIGLSSKSATGQSSAVSFVISMATVNAAVARRTVPVRDAIDNDTCQVSFA